MTPPAILVTGIGAIIGQGIIKSLRMSDRDVRIIGLDRNKAAFGAHLCDGFYAKPSDESEEGYSDFIHSLILKEHIELVLPGIEQDLYYFHDNRHIVRDTGAVLALNHGLLIEMGRDKWLTHKKLRDAGMATIPTCVTGTWDECLAELGRAPVLFKPRHGSGGRGHAFLLNEDDFNYWKKKDSSDFMVQRIVGSADSEYTVSVFGLGDGTATPPAVLRRSIGPGGATWSAEVVHSDEAIEAFVAKFNRLFTPLGPTNYQFRKEGNIAYLLEINPRFSSATSLRAALGYNEASMCVDYFLLKTPPRFSPLASARCHRYIEDHIERL